MRGVLLVLAIALGFKIGYELMVKLEARLVIAEAESALTGC